MLKLKLQYFGHLMRRADSFEKTLMVGKIEGGRRRGLQKMRIMASGPITSWEMDGKTVETVSDFVFWAPKSLQMVTAAMKLKDAYSLEGKFDQPR